MNRIVIVLLAACLSALATLCYAYEPDTHQKITDDAANASVLVSDSLNGTPAITTTILDDLGIDTYAGSDQYPDSQAGQTVDGVDGPDITAPPSGNAQDLLKAGAAIEDRDASDRSFCHFFDPVPGHTQALNIGSLTASFDDPDWATGVSGTSTCTLGTLPLWGAEQQKYSLDNAKTYYLNALTAPKKTDRVQAFGDLFLSIGHVLHLLQDMAQPQHVRNDMHCDNPACLLIGFYDPSRYEKFVYSHYDATPPVASTTSFTTRLNFWTGGIGGKEGLADFTNRNFISEGTMDVFTNPGGPHKYAQPQNDNNSSSWTLDQLYAQWSESVPSQLASICNPTSICTVKFFESSGPDIVNPWAVSESVFNRDLTALNGHQSYALNRWTFVQAEQLLLPMAKNYSTDLINYFFRGRLGVRLDPATGNYIVTNLSNFAMSNGTLSVYYDDAQGNRTLLPVTLPNGQSPNPVSLLANCNNGCGDSITVTVSSPSPAQPVPAVPGLYMFVFNGTIGSEAGIAAKLFGPGPYIGESIATNSSNMVSEYTRDGSQIANNIVLTSGSANVPRYLAIYGKSIYTSPVPPSGSGGIVMSYPYLNGQYAAGVPLFTSGNVVQSGVTVNLQLEQGLATNSTDVFVPVTSSGATPPWELLVFDRNNNALAPIHEQFNTTTLSANDQSICKSGQQLQDDGTYDQVTLLQDFNGATIKTLMEVPYTGNAVVICGSSKDRHYVLVQTFDSSGVVQSSTLSVYDAVEDPGNGVATFTLNTLLPAVQITADEGNVYIGYNNGAGVAGFTILKRTVVTNVNGGFVSESYQLVSNVSDASATGGAALDMKNVLNH